MNTVGRGSRNYLTWTWECQDSILIAETAEKVRSQNLASRICQGKRSSDQMEERALIVDSIEAYALYEDSSLVLMIAGKIR